MSYRPPTFPRGPLNFGTPQTPQFGNQQTPQLGNQQIPHLGNQQGPMLGNPQGPPFPYGTPIQHNLQPPQGQHPPPPGVPPAGAYPPPPPPGNPPPGQQQFTGPGIPLTPANQTRQNLGLETLIAPEDGEDEEVDVVPANLSPEQMADLLTQLVRHQQHSEKLAPIGVRPEWC